MRLLVTGSRNLRDYALVTRAMTVAIDELRYAHPDDREIIVVSGKQKSVDKITGEEYGADFLCEKYVDHVRKFLEGKGYSIRVEGHPADWEKYGKFAGPKRNQEMVDAGADLCIAFFVGDRSLSKGTKHCLTAAKKAGIKVLEFDA